MKNKEPSLLARHSFMAITVVMVTIVAVIFHFMQFPILIPVLFFACGMHLFFIRKASLRLFLSLTLLLLLEIFLIHIVMSYSTISSFYVPVASIPMLTMLLFNDLFLTFLMSFLSNILAASLLGWGLDFMLVFFISGLMGAYIVRDARTRGRLIEAGLVVGVLQVLSFFLILQNFDENIMVGVYKPLLINGFISAGIVAATLRIFEGLFGVLTNYTLLEMADSSNQRLLKQMILEAPGTYHHSLIVSNLSEAAAEAIGAHGLLARVGALYHDIGKLVKPEYFTENQMMMRNKHDELEPSMSRLVVQNHVREGVELAHKNKLNQRLIDFIPEHHGSSLMHYFYQKALEEAQGDEVVEEENFRYPGPKPQSRETAIVMLADSVEGATRSLPEHTPQRIEEIVRKVINNKFIDGQLDECPLTLKDIELISSTFCRILMAMYHGRVKYPEKKSNGNPHPGHSKENPHPSATDQARHPNDPV